MHRRSIILLVVVMGISLLMATNLWSTQASPDWIALYEQKLGRPIEEISEAPLMARLEADKWDDPRITSAHLKDGTTLLLGLPRDNPRSAEEIVESSVVLDLDAAQQRCEEQLEPNQYGWSWRSSVEEETNTFQINALPARSKEEARRLYDDPLHRDPYCELEFTDQWRLSMVKPVEVIEATP